MNSYELPELAYDYSALEPHIIGRIMELHHDKHHGGYVKKANAALEKLTEARSNDDFDHINQLEKDLAFNVSGHVLHTVFWTCMSPDGGGKPEGDLAAAIDEFYGSFEDFRAQLTAATENVQGSGWGVLSWEPLGSRLLVEQVYDHQGNVGQGAIPLLVIDAWEHAYYLQYENDKAGFFDAFWKIVDWPSVATRFDRVRQIDLRYSYAATSSS